eukprot:265337_1
MPLISGILIVFFGLYNSSLLFYFIILIGQTVWVISLMGSGSYPFMLVGRGLFGSGAETFHTARKILLFDYFTGTEYSLASGISLSLSRIASASQSNISPIIYDKYNSVIAVLSIGTILIYISFLLLLIFITYIKCKSSNIYNYTNNNEETSILIRKIKEKREIHLNAIWTGKFDKRILFLGFALCTFYDSYLCFSTIGASYISFQYNYSFNPISTNLMSIPYYVSAVLTPIFGYIVDRFGHRCHLLFISAIFILFGHVILGYINKLYFNIYDEYYLIPIIGLICLGFGYGIFGAIVWPSFALIVERKYLATILGVFGSIDNGLRATLFLIVGEITQDNSDNEKYKYVTYFLLFLSINNFLWVTLLWYFDKYKFGNRLNDIELKFLSHEQKMKDKRRYMLFSDCSMSGTNKYGCNEKHLTADFNDERSIDNLTELAGK